MACQVIGDPIKQSAKLSGEPISIIGKPALRMTLARPGAQPCGGAAGDGPLEYEPRLSFELQGFRDLKLRFRTRVSESNAVKAGPGPEPGAPSGPRHPLGRRPPRSCWAAGAPAEASIVTSRARQHFSASQREFLCPQAGTQQVIGSGVDRGLVNRGWVAERGAFSHSSAVPCARGRGRNSSAHRAAW